MAVKSGRLTSILIVNRRSATIVSAAVSRPAASCVLRGARARRPLSSRRSCATQRAAIARGPLSGRAPLVLKEAPHVVAKRLAERARKQPQQQVEEDHDVHRLTDWRVAGAETS